MIYGFFPAVTLGTIMKPKPHSAVEKDENNSNVNII